MADNDFNFGQFSPAATKPSGGDNFFAQFGPPPAAPVNGNGNFFAQFGPAPSDAPTKITVHPRGGSEVSTGQAATLGGMSGASANFHDEIYGASEASGLPSWLGGFRAPVGGARLLYENLTGDNDGPATKAYQAGRDRVRALQKAAKEQHPVAYTVGEVGGALATLPLAPQVTVVKGAGLAPRIVNSAITNAGYGALYGAGEGEGAADTGQQALTGGAVGGGIGAVTPPVIAAVTKPFRSLLGGLTKEGRDAIAARQVVGALDKDAPGGAAKAADALDLASTTNTPAIVADLGDNTTRRLADAASIKSTGANNAFERVFSDRSGSQKGRAIDEVHAIIGGPVDSVPAREALTEAARVSNKANYGRFLKASDDQVYSPELERLAGSDAVAAAMKNAVSSSKDRSILDGFGTMNPRAQVSADGRVTFKRANGEVGFPNGQMWDYTYREVRDAASEAFRKGRGEEGNRLKGIANALRDELDRLVPTYADARAGAARFFGADNALEAGETFATSRMQNSEARAALAKMTAEQKRAFAYGFASDFIKKIREAPDRANLMNRVINSDAARERLELALGPDAARRMEAFARLENMMNKTKEAVTGNSKSAQRFVDAGIISGGLGYDLANGDFGPSSFGTMAIVGALTKAGRRQINEKIATKVGELLASNDPKALREAIDLAAKSPRVLDAIRRADSLVSRVTSATNPGGPALLGNAASRADDQEKRR